MRLAHTRQRGAATILAMLFLTVFASLAAAMAMVTRVDLRTADATQRANRAMVAAEAGLEYARARLAERVAQHVTTKGQIDATVANSVWPGVIGAFNTELAGQSTYDNGWVRLDAEADAPRFRITVAQHPISGEDYGATAYQRPPYSLSNDNAYTADGAPVSATNPVAPWWTRVTVTGADAGIERTIRLDVQLGKRVGHAILSRSRIMIGRNVIIDGPVGSRYTRTDVKHGHPVQMRDNFHSLNDELDGWLNDLSDHLADHDEDGDNRVALADDRETQGLDDPAALDHDGNGFIEPYDLFMLSYDDNADGRVSSGEFADADPQLWQLIHEAKYPAGTEFDWANGRVNIPGQGWIEAADDLGHLDASDNYAKLHGRVSMTAAKADWESGAADGPYQNYFRGSIVPELYEDPLTFQADTADLTPLGPDDFDVSTYRTMAGGSFADQVDTPTPNDPQSPAVFTPAGPETLEAVPYNSPHPYDHYARPVYENMTFTDVTIPRGTNALFVNCRFKGVTFVDTAVDNDHANFSYAGMQNADGGLKYMSVQAEVDGQAVADTKPHSNNLRFHDCQFDGVVVGENTQAFVHTRNKLQFTGATQFDIDAPGLTAEQIELFRRSTIMAPQHSIDMGTFTQPTAGGETTHLDGTIVAGVLDVRGQAVIDGSLITTYEPIEGQGPLAEGGSPANFNTTIGYFESTAGDSEAEIPDAGFGKILIRYDPDRPMPDGITAPLVMIADMDSYTEGTP